MSGTARIRTTAVAAGCAIALGSMLGACGSGSSTSAPPKGGITGTTAAPSTPIPSTPIASTPTETTTAPGVLAGTHTPAKPPSSPSTPAGGQASTPAPVVSEFLTADQLPAGKTYGWTREYITPVHVEEPLVATCPALGGTELNTDVWDALYPSSDHQSSAEEVVHTYASASYAASRVAAFFPKCAGITAQTSTGFAWRSTGSEGTSHTLYARWDNKVATLVIRMHEGDYDPSLDAKLLATMTQRLENS
ncbi:hypothetical protein ABH920_000518 [Catenulispora sp. EB89]|uniref:hypothetical protein n=1 Tax=Catenulispora sp. EB89 TaxID=3156257 RepID=UPI003511BA4F